LLKLNAWYSGQFRGDKWIFKNKIVLSLELKY
jgi:hypothetical protein